MYDSFQRKLCFIALLIIDKVCRFNAISLKNSMMYFTELKQIFQKFIWNHQRTYKATDPEKEEQSWKDHTA